mmetsp:Transcript_91568/g.286539  ORF Transcript_91568/g.286539 Transcript_91568/m.286539 type:complete len:297 (-) Transcript_91568:49-939(-)
MFADCSPRSGGVRDRVPEPSNGRSGCCQPDSATPPPLVGGSSSSGTWEAEAPTPPTSDEGAGDSQDQSPKCWEQQVWECPACTLINKGTDEACAACDRPRGGFDGLGFARQGWEPGSWSCPVCTLVNGACRLACAACEGPRLAVLDGAAPWKEEPELKEEAPAPEEPSALHTLNKGLLYAIGPARCDDDSPRGAAPHGGPPRRDDDGRTAAHCATAISDWTLAATAAATFQPWCFGPSAWPGLRAQQLFELGEEAVMGVPPQAEPRRPNRRAPAGGLAASIARRWYSCCGRSGKGS